ncbi:hypothetical protein J8F10_07285 [Gemmata sp. G18]|uniref:Uncharacterized protein n=1 Tax=Gemmata palustris TaxID=2822762 RepID=A0ABS5BMZ3_9BACT|nr:hypothetical protein [Gemmata palustris]MBP3955081.1 hypothetical protein [Gemmata palustris]
MLLTPLVVSGWSFTAPDRAGRAARGHTVSSLRALVWLSLRQLRLTGPVLSAFALAFGFVLLVPEARRCSFGRHWRWPPGCWPGSPRSATSRRTGSRPSGPRAGSRSGARGG